MTQTNSYMMKIGIDKGGESLIRPRRAILGLKPIRELKSGLASAFVCQSLCSAITWLSLSCPAQVVVKSTRETFGNAKVRVSRGVFLLAEKVFLRGAIIGQRRLRVKLARWLAKSAQGGWNWVALPKTSFFSFLVRFWRPRIGTFRENFKKIQNIGTINESPETEILFLHLEKWTYLPREMNPPRSNQRKAIDFLQTKWTYVAQCIEKSPKNFEYQRIGKELNISPTTFTLILFIP